MDNPHPSALQHSRTRINIDTSKISLVELHQLAVSQRGRIELTSNDGSTCVLITRNELDALEQALEILAETSEVQAMRKELAQVAALASRLA